MTTAVLTTLTLLAFGGVLAALVVLVGEARGKMIAALSGASWTAAEKPVLALRPVRVSRRPTSRPGYASAPSAWRAAA